MSQQIENQEKANTETGDKSGSRLGSEKRRHLIKGIGVSAPLMMTVASRPVLGAQCTPSAWVSGNLSAQAETFSCGGRSPGYWKTDPSRWTGTGYVPGTCGDSRVTGICRRFNSDGTPFHRSAGGVCAGSTFGSNSMMQVLWMRRRQDHYQLGAHIVAALLNAASIPDYGMSQSDVLDMYSQLANSGSYQPTAGFTMTAEDCVRFIRNTFD